MSFFKLCTPVYSLQIVISNRLVLNLIQGVDAREGSVYRSRTGLEPPTFAAGPYLGNIGGPVRNLLDDSDDRELVDGNGANNYGDPENLLGGPPGKNSHVEINDIADLVWDA